MSKNMSWDYILTIIVLIVLIAIYCYLLFSPTQPHVLKAPRSFVISPDTSENYAIFLKDTVAAVSSSSSRSWYDDFSSGKNITDDLWGEQREKDGDDFFMQPIDDPYGSRGKEEPESFAPNVPSNKYTCQKGWVSIRSELNYKYLWMHAGENMWMGASATIDTPLSRKSFFMQPVMDNCSDGWVLLREADLPGYIQMMAPSGSFAIDEWAVKQGTDQLEVAQKDPSYHFLFEDDGYILNRGALAFVNVMAEAEYTVRGHTGGWDRTRAAGREYSAAMKFTALEEDMVTKALDKERKEEAEAQAQDKDLIAQIQSFPTSTEKRVISFGLYGTKDKYCVGAVRNAELAKTYFPGWTCRFYVTSDVPETIISQLKALNAEILPIPSNMGYSSGMFWRFMAAADETVDRYIIRDSDSRLNARDRIAVEEWIRLKYPVHVIRDHINHCLPMSGGMWGGIKGAIPDMKSEILGWSSRDEYAADLHFLDQRIWPLVRDKQLSHDSYCCDRYPHTRPFPTRRASTYQHVGQVFDANDNPRLMDIDGFIRGVPIPVSCRKQADWIYG